jgi:uncharacterized lipoprotein YajG
MQEQMYLKQLAICVHQIMLAICVHQITLAICVHQITLGDVDALKA